jgi:hypothetical protein
MTLAITVTKKSVSKNMDKLWNISMNMTLFDETVEVINKDYSIRYISGDDIVEKTNQLKIQMQADINKYKAEQAIFMNAQLDTAVSTVQAGLVV